MITRYFALVLLAATVGTFAQEMPSPAEPDPTPLHAEWYTEFGENAAFTHHPGGRFTMQWTSRSGYTIGGLGWKPGQSNRTLSYAGTHRIAGNGIFGLYGWTRNPLVEYYIVDTYGILNPSSHAHSRGSIEIDGGVYRVANTTRVNLPSIDGTATFQQFWSVRQNKRVGGKIDIGAHFRAWEARGMVLGRDHYYQILACEGYFSSGSCDITVSDIPP